MTGQEMSEQVGTRWDRSRRTGHRVGPARKDQENMPWGHYAQKSQCPILPINVKLLIIFAIIV